MQNAKIIALCVVGALLLSLFSFLIYTNHSLNAELTKTKEKLAECNISIEVQNKAIEQLALDADEFKNNYVSEVKQIDARYSRVEASDIESSCELKIRNIDNALQIFFAR